MLRVGWRNFFFSCAVVSVFCRVISNRYFPVGIGRYFLVFTIPIPKEISVSTFRYHFFGGNPLFPQKGALAPFLRKKGGTGPLFDTASPPFVEKRSSRQISNTDRKYQPPSKSDTGKITIPKKLLVTPWFNSSFLFWQEIGFDFTYYLCT